MGAVTATRKTDQLGGLEIVEWHIGQYEIREVGQGQPLQVDWTWPRKRLAAAVRQMLLDAAGRDWSDLPRSGNGYLDDSRIDEPTRTRINRVSQLVYDQNARDAYGLCPACGYLPRSCHCDQPATDRDPRRWTAADMAWAL